LLGRKVKRGGLGELPSTISRPKPEILQPYPASRGHGYVIGLDVTVGEIRLVTDRQSAQQIFEYDQRSLGAKSTMGTQQRPQRRSIDVLTDDSSTIVTCHITVDAGDAGLANSD
jgi:hypothetical protein